MRPCCDSTTGLTNGSDILMIGSMLGSRLGGRRMPTQYSCVRRCHRYRRLQSAARALVPLSPEQHTVEVVRRTFEPHVDGSSLVVLGVFAGLAAYWWLVLVPSERASLAREKRRGAVGQYLQVTSTTMHVLMQLAMRSHRCFPCLQPSVALLPCMHAGGQGRPQQRDGALVLQ